MYTYIMGITSFTRVHVVFYPNRRYPDNNTHYNIIIQCIYQMSAEFVSSSSTHRENLYIILLYSFCMRVAYLYMPTVYARIIPMNILSRKTRQEASEKIKKKKKLNESNGILAR